MDDHISNKLNSNATSISNVDIDTSSVNGLEAVHYKLLLQCDHHVTLEHNPQRPVLDDSVTEGSGPGVYRVIMTRVTYNVVLSITATDGVAAESNTAVG